MVMFFLTGLSAGATIRQTRRSPRAQSRGGRKNVQKRGAKRTKNDQRGLQNLSKIAKEGC